MYQLLFCFLSRRRIENNPRKMDEILTRFPKLGEGILNNLNNENLVKCREVKRSWRRRMDGEKFYWRRVIKKYIDGIEEFKETWNMVMWYYSHFRL